MRVCCIQKEEYFEFANKILNSDFEPMKSRCLTSIGNNGDILGVVIFDRFTTHCCELSIASVTPRFISRSLILNTFDYIFNACDRIRVTTIVNDKNEKSLNLQRKMGFVEEARLKNFYGKDDGILFRMLKEECAWITPYNPLTSRGRK